MEVTQREEEIDGKVWDRYEWQLEMAYESKLMQLKDLGLLQECEVVLQATRDTGGNLWGKNGS